MFPRFRCVQIFFKPVRVAGWFVAFLFFCVEVIDGAQQCSILQVISGDFDGIIDRHSCWAGFSMLGVGSFRSFRVSWVCCTVSSD